MIQVQQSRFISLLGNGELAQLARAPALHAGGQGFDSLILHRKAVKPAKFFEVLDVFYWMRWSYGSGSIPGVFTIPTSQPILIYSRQDRRLGKRSLTYWKELDF